MASTSTSTSSAHCSAVNCSNRQSKRPDLSFFKFPKNKERCQQWVQNTRRQDLIHRTPEYVSNNCRLCSEHFELHHFSNKMTKNRLQWNAVPTLFEIPNPLKCLSTPRRSLKRKSENLPSSPKPSKKQRVRHNTQAEHSYCLAADQIHDNEPSSVFPTPGTDDPQFTPNVTDTRALKKERRRTFRLKKRVELLKRSMDKETKKSKTISDLIRGAGEFLQKPALSFFASQLRNALGCRGSRGRRWSYSDKVLVLSLYHQSPRAYQFCQRIFTLPSITSLRRWLSNIEVRPGFARNVFELLKDRVAGMTERDTFCVVSFDEMSLRAGLSYNITADSVEGFEDFGSQGKTSRPANHALVFMARGLMGKWKQPLGYFLSRDTSTAGKLETLLKECLQKVKAIGLQPKVVVCDQSSRNVRLYTKLGVTEDNPFFVHGGGKIYCMHDPPHLLKNTRPNLEKYVFEVKREDGSKKHIRWSHICNFYDLDSQLPIRKAHKLTRGHFVLNSFSKMGVNKAAQVLSHSVAAGVYTYSAIGKLPGEAIYTAEFIEMIDGLFDSFNSRFFKDPKKLRRPISDNSAHKSFFDSCLPVLQSLTVLGSKNVLFIKGWQLAISCVSRLWQHMKESTDVRFLFTSRLNQDIVENLFSTIRRKGRFRDNPSAKEFRCAFRMVMVAKLIKPAVSANCSPDSDTFILKLQTLTKSRVKRSSPSLSHANKTKQDNAVYSILLDLPEVNTLTYIAGHICCRIITSHELSSTCQTCREVLLPPDAPLVDPALVFIHHKTYDTSTSDFGSLMVPSEYFLAFCEVCEKVFCTEFDDIKMTRNNISHLINQAIQNTQEYKDMNLCSERIKARIVSIFVSVRIHYGLKFKNRKLQDMTIKKKCRKVQKVQHKQST